VSSDPVRLLWDALEAAGYRPRGKEYEFRARCPGHAGGNPTSLSVGVGADGRALLRCHAHGCEPTAILAPIGLEVSDLFPAGHRRGRRYPLRLVRREDFGGTARQVVNLLRALEELDEDWFLMLGCACPYCGDPGGWLRASPGRIEVDCAAGCDAQTFTQALLGRLHEKEKTG
jgi:hypothetical protein